MSTLVAKCAWASTAAAAALAAAQPASGDSWLIHTIKSEVGVLVDVEMTSDAGTTWKKVDQYSGGSVHGLIYRVTNTIYLRLVNRDAATKFIGYEGVLDP